MATRLASAACIVVGLLLSVAAAGDTLRDDFASPPDSARPWVYWFFMDGNLSREGITADLESMAEVGIGGLILMEVDVGIPRGPVEFMSDEWRALFKHAVEEAERLGLEITLNAGPGWTGSGGPWVKAEQSMQHLVASSVEVTGPASFDGVLPIPEARKPYFGESGLPEWLLAARRDFYVDEAVLAVPRKGDGAIKHLDEKALFVREPYTSKPGIAPFIPAPSSHPELPAKTIPAGEVIDLTGQLQPDGRLAWTVPPGEWTILRFGRRNTGANTRPAPLPGLGLESDKFDPAALDAHFEAFVGRLLEAVGPRPSDRKVGWTMLHIDSWEMGSQNWTAKFAKEFEQRRGYFPRPWLPVMTGRIVGSAEQSERFLWDLRQTAQELVLEYHAGHLKELGRQHGFGLSIEPYDMNPTADMSLGGVADVPMCEFWSRGHGFDSNFTCYESTSIAHTLGRPIVAAEAFTAADSEAWQLYPALMKNQGDWALATGINRIVFHRFAHQPWLDRQPGMTMGPYGVHWDRTQTWWPMVSAYHQYLARCQYLLRQGSTVADICYLVPEGAPHVFRPPPSALAGEFGDRRGYNFDGCAPETLLLKAEVNDGNVVFPGGASYRILVLPAFDTMTPALLRKIETLLEAGATVIGTPPLKSPSLSGYPACDQDVLSIATKLWGGLEAPAAVTERNAGKGRLVWGGNLAVDKPGEAYPQESAQPHWKVYPDYEPTAAVLQSMGVPEDFATDGPIRYTHRRTEDRDLYFVANQSVERVESVCTFRVSGRNAELWDPVTGTTRPLNAVAKSDGRTSITMRFDAHQSFFVVFSTSTAPKADSLEDFSTPQTIATLDGSWEVAFHEKRGAPGTVVFDKLLDWTQHPDERVRHYSGIATYRKTFDCPTADGPVLLDIGELPGMARVRLNGHDLGVLWCAPWRLDITAAVKPTDNELEIDVANRWPNRLIGDSALPEDQRIAWTTWSPYKPDSPLLPSGLRGPAQLMTSEIK